LAAILIYVGYKLAKPSLIKQEWAKGNMSFVPFVVTVVSILFTDLLIGIMIGMAVGFFYIIKSNFHKSITLVQINDNYMVRFQQQATFLNKSLLKTVLDELPARANVIMDLTHCTFMDRDILDIIDDFQIRAKEKSMVISFEFLNESHKQKLLGELNCNFISKIKESNT
jgi:MFS superfamily sulfate permease-like transporter